MFELVTINQPTALYKSTKGISIAYSNNNDIIFTKHFHSCFEIFFCMNENILCTIGNAHFEIGIGDLFLIPPKQNHYYINRAKNTANSVFVYIHPDYLHFLSSKDTPLDYGFRSLENSYAKKVSLNYTAQKRFLEYIYSFESITGFGKDLKIQSLLTELLIYINELLMEMPEQRVNNSRNNPLIEDILQYINQNITSTLTLNDIASTYYISPNYLCRLFKTTTGITVNQYITRKRIDMAKMLLSQGCSTGYVCSACGFNDYSNFFRAFSKETGMSPKKYTKIS